MHVLKVNELTSCTDVGDCARFLIDTRRGVTFVLDAGDYHDSCADKIMQTHYTSIPPSSPDYASALETLVPSIITHQPQGYSLTTGASSLEKQRNVRHTTAQLEHAHNLIRSQIFRSGISPAEEEICTVFLKTA